MRQLNALNSLVKTSIKDKHELLFSIHGEDEVIYKTLTSEDRESFGHGNTSDNGNGGVDSRGGAHSLFTNLHQDEMKFKNQINLQSQNRIVFLIYRLTSFLFMMYNVPLTLSVNDLHQLAIADKTDEYLWNFKSFQEFQEACQDHQNEHETISFYINRRKIIRYKELLLKIAKNANPEKPPSPDLDTYIKENLQSLSQFGYVCLVHGFYEIMLYKELKKINLFKVLNEVSECFPLPIGVGMFGTEDYARLDYAMLVNYTKLSTVFDLGAIKTFSWLANYDEMVGAFGNILNSGNPEGPQNTLDNVNYLQTLDSALIILKLSLFKAKVVKGDEVDSNREHGHQYNQNQNQNQNRYRHQSHQNSHHHPVLFSSNASGQSNNDLFSTDFGYLDNNSNSENNVQQSPQTDTRHNSKLIARQFEEMMHLVVTDEFVPTTNLIHSQMLFHVFSILGIVSIILLKKRMDHEMGINIDENEDNKDLLAEMNGKFLAIVSLLDKVKHNLQVKFQALAGDPRAIHSNGNSNSIMLGDAGVAQYSNSNSNNNNNGLMAGMLGAQGPSTLNKFEDNNNFTSLYLFNGIEGNANSAFPAATPNHGSNDNNGENGNNHAMGMNANTGYDLEKTLYILKIGETLLYYMYDTNFQVSVFKKLADNLSQIRKYIIDNESFLLN